MTLYQTVFTTCMYTTIFELPIHYFNYMKSSILIFTQRLVAEQSAARLFCSDPPFLFNCCVVVISVVICTINPYLVPALVSLLVCNVH